MNIPNSNLPKSPPAKLALADANDDLKTLPIAALKAIGENSAPLRAALCGKLSSLGVKLDEPANTSGGPRVSTADSDVSVWVIPTDEELMIAQHTLALIGPQPDAYRACFAPWRRERRRSRCAHRSTDRGRASVLQWLRHIRTLHSGNEPGPAIPALAPIETGGCKTPASVRNKPKVRSSK